MLKMLYCLEKSRRITVALGIRPQTSVDLRRIGAATEERGGRSPPYRPRMKFWPFSKSPRSAEFFKGGLTSLVYYKHKLYN